MSKGLSLCMALLLATALVARADDNKPITNAGASNLMFTFGGLSSLAAGPIITATGGGTGNAGIQVAGVGYRYFLANELALRGTLGLVMSSTTAKSSSTGFSDHTSSGTGVMIGAAVEKHMAAASSVSAHMGALVGFLLGSSKDTPSHASGQSDASTTYKGTDLSLAVYAGAEWFFNSAMSLGAEYQFGFVTSSSTSTYDNGSSSTSTDGPSQTVIGTNSVNAILNVYIGR